MVKPDPSAAALTVFPAQVKVFKAADLLPEESSIAVTVVVLPESVAANTAGAPTEVNVSARDNTSAAIFLECLRIMNSSCLFPYQSQCVNMTVSYSDPHPSQDLFSAGSLFFIHPENAGPFCFDTIWDVFFF